MTASGAPAPRGSFLTRKAPVAAVVGGGLSSKQAPQSAFAPHPAAPAGSNLGSADPAAGAKGTAAAVGGRSSLPSSNSTGSAHTGFISSSSMTKPRTAAVPAPPAVVAAAGSNPVVQPQQRSFFPGSAAAAAAAAGGTGGAGSGGRHFLAGSRATGGIGGGASGGGRVKRFGGSLQQPIMKQHKPEPNSDVALATASNSAPAASGLADRPAPALLGAAPAAARSEAATDPTPKAALTGLAEQQIDLAVRTSAPGVDSMPGSSLVAAPLPPKPATLLGASAAGGTGADGPAAIGGSSSSEGFGGGSSSSSGAGMGAPGSRAGMEGSLGRGEGSAGVAAGGVCVVGGVVLPGSPLPPPASKLLQEPLNRLEEVRLVAAVGSGSCLCGAWREYNAGLTSGER